jgi:formamidopyrimidine-DNA glycosylase
MPELPEVETIRRHLERHVVGRTIASVWTSGLALRRPVPRTFAAALAGRSIAGVGRHGKFLILALDDGARLVAHLGMTGKFLLRLPEIAADPKPAHTHAELRFTDGAILLFVDPRRFGLLDFRPAGAGDDGLGPPGSGIDPVAEQLTGERLRGLFRRCRGPIKHVLLDQRRIAGIGNIYACEILFRAAIAPRRLVHTLKPEERERLAGEIHIVLGRAIENRGTTFSDFRDLDDRPGDYAVALQVYDREGEACLRCGTTIRRIVQTGRSTFWCPGCQRREVRNVARNSAGLNGRNGSAVPRVTNPRRRNRRAL